MRPVNLEFCYVLKNGEKSSIDPISSIEDHGETFTVCNMYGRYDFRWDEIEKHEIKMMTDKLTGDADG